MLYEEMRSYCYRHGRWDEEHKFDRRSSGISKEEFKDFLTSHNFTKDSWGTWDNGTIKISSINSGYNEGTIYEIAHIQFKNSKTDACLKYEGKSFGEYIFDLYVKNYTDYYTKGMDATRYQFTGDSNSWKEFFFKEFEIAIDKLNTKWALKHKKDKIADNLQQIENEIDYAIEEVADELKQYNIKLETTNNEIASTTLTYRFSKDIKARIHLPCIIIRKLKNGKNTMCYRDYNTYDNDFSVWKKVKDGTTPDEIKQFIKDYFEPWYGLKDIYIKKPGFVD